VEGILKELDAYGGTFWEIGEHVPIAGIRSGIKALKAAGADIIVSVGGGSPIDASKAIIYNLQKESGGTFLRQIAVPTTLSAAEYTVILLRIYRLPSINNHACRLEQALQTTMGSR
jgi:alcohol dehydrogenase class IV